jgi:hypothetical protein
MVPKVKCPFLQQPITAAALARLLLSMTVYSRAQDDTTPYTVNAGAGVSPFIRHYRITFHDDWGFYD